MGIKIPGRRRSYRHPDSQILLWGYNIHQHLGDYIRYTFFYPGYELTIGSSGDKVSQLQRQLARIALNYPAIGTVTVDGVYGQNTADAVRKFQQIFNLPVTGVTDYKTWYKISQIYVGVTKIAENV